MSLKINPAFRPALLGAAILIGVTGVGLSGCGKKGLLETPAPLFGDRAKADYDAKQNGAAIHTDAASGPKAAADQPDPDADNAPRTTRDIKDPAQDPRPITQAPLPGAPDSMGVTPSMQPPGR